MKLLVSAFLHLFWYVWIQITKNSNSRWCYVDFFVSPILLTFEHIVPYINLVVKNSDSKAPVWVYWANIDPNHVFFLPSFSFPHLKWRKHMSFPVNFRQNAIKKPAEIVIKAGFFSSRFQWLLHFSLVSSIARKPTLFPSVSHFAPHESSSLKL